MKGPSYEVVLAPNVLEALEAIADPRLRGDISRRIDGLQEDPAGKGRALTGELSGFYVVRNLEAGYRIVYKVEAERVVVCALSVKTGGGAMRSATAADLHSLARRLVAMRLFEPAFLRSAVGPGAGRPRGSKTPRREVTPGRGRRRRGGQSDGIDRE